MSERRYAREQHLPDNSRSVLRSLFKQEDPQRFQYVKRLYSLGWTLRAIGEAFSPVVPRSTVQYWIEREDDLTVPELELPLSFIDVPNLKTSPNGYQRLTPPPQPIPLEDASRLNEIAKIARYYRSGMASTSLQAVANDDMDEIVSRLYRDGVKIADIARASGVTHRAIKKRLDKLGEN